MNLVLPLVLGLTAAVDIDWQFGSSYEDLTLAAGTAINFTPIPVGGHSVFSKVLTGDTCTCGGGTNTGASTFIVPTDAEAGTKYCIYCAKGDGLHCDEGTMLMKVTVADVDVWDGDEGDDPLAPSPPAGAGSYGSIATPAATPIPVPAPAPTPNEQCHEIAAGIFYGLTVLSTIMVIVLTLVLSGKIEVGGYSLVSRSSAERGFSDNPLYGHRQPGATAPPPSLAISQPDSGQYDPSGAESGLEIGGARPSAPPAVPLATGQEQTGTALSDPRADSIAVLRPPRQRDLSF